MGITDHGTNRCFTAGWGLVAKPCDFCNSTAALLFCPTDSAFLCVACDAKMHPPTATGKIGPTTRHERVWMCEVCEQAPASVTCKADAAALCVTCDRNIHSANPLAQRHERSPVVPFYDTAESVVKTTAAAAAAFLVPTPTTPPIMNPDSNMVNVSPPGHEYCVSDAWISSNPMNPKVQADAAPDIKSMEFLFSDSDNYLDFDYPISSETRGFQHDYSSGADGVVPVQMIKPQFLPSNLPTHHHHSSGKRFEIDFTKSNISYGFTAAQSLSHSVSSSSLDVGVVPDGSSMSEISYPFGRNLSNVDMSGASSGENQGSQLAAGMDREARVLRYREKRKNRKFEKTIRYASRKAYAETRPRIKGRFAKRTDTVDSDIDCMFSPSSAAAAFLSRIKIRCRSVVLMEGN